MTPLVSKSRFAALFCSCFLTMAALAVNAPSNLVATAASSSDITLTWTDNSTDEIGFTFMVDTNSSFTNPSYVWTGGANVTSYTHTGRSAATTYYYRIKAEGSTDALDSGWTSTAGATTAPAGLNAAAASSSAVNLSWTANAGNPSITGYTYSYASNSSFTGATYVWVSGNGSSSATRTGLSAATTYWWRVKAEGSTDALDSPNGNAVAATTMPASLTATAVSGSQINLSWSGNASNANITGYTVATSTTNSFSGATYQYVSGAGATSLSKTGLTAGTTYYFAVKAEGTSDAYDSPFTAFTSASTTMTPSAISPRFFGINAWMPYQIGAHVYYGQLGSQWSNVQASGAKIMRYGGNGVDHHADPLWADPNDSTKSTLKQYLDLVNQMQSRGIEPLLQVPVYGTTYDATDAADIVRYINVTHAKGVKYWTIGNEPDLPGGAYGYTTAAQVASYFKPIASAMKAVDPTIKIVGPDTAWYNETIINGLTTCGGTYDITGRDASGRTYVDVLSFHHYNGFDGTQDRDAVVASLMAPGGFNDHLGALKQRAKACSDYWNRTGDAALTIAVTEANVNYANSAGDSLTGAGARSFVGGQWWAEALGIAMKHGVDFVTFWSTIEGSTTSGNELGFIRADGTTKQPSYYHFQMMAQNFRGNAVNASDNQSLVKTCAAKASDQVAVLIMNQDRVNAFNYTVRLDTGAASANALKVNVDAGLAVESTGTIATESTLLLVFDAAGTLKKKIEYKLNGHASANLPPAVTNY